MRRRPIMWGAWLSSGGCSARTPGPPPRRYGRVHPRSLARGRTDAPLPTRFLAAHIAHCPSIAEPPNANQDRRSEHDQLPWCPTSSRTTIEVIA
jgi:hypothetical protein